MSRRRLEPRAAAIGHAHHFARMFFSAFMHCALARIPVLSPQARQRFFFFVQFS